MHLGGWLLQDREQFIDGMQVAHDHNHQGFQEQTIRIGLWPAARSFGGWGRKWQPLDQAYEHDKQRILSYHSGASVLFGLATTMMRRWPRIRQAETRPFDL